MAIVMGAEGEGMRRLTREHCDVLVKIPMAGSVSSLNVSVAAAVSLYEASRQLSKNGHYEKAQLSDSEYKTTVDCWLEK